jgi:hypothetical protein
MSQVKKPIFDVPIFNPSNYDQTTTTTITTNTSTSEWSTPQLNNVTATGATNPSKGTTSVDYIMSRLLDATTKEYEVIGQITVTSGGSAGSGDYLFQLPDNLSFASTFGQTTYQSSASKVAYRAMLVNGSGIVSVDIFGSVVGIIPYNATRFRLYGIAGSNPDIFIGSGGYFFGNPSVPLIWKFRFTFFAV